MYTPTARTEIADRLIHLRNLFRALRPPDAESLRAQEKREAITKNLLSNLGRTKDHPTLRTVLDVAEIFPLTVEGAHRLFGYDIDGIRAFDQAINAGRTHIIESHVFRRDKQIELPLRLSTSEAFRETAPLSRLVREWQKDLPIRVLDRPGWKRPGTFYVRVGTEDSLGSSLPPGSIAQVQPIDEAEAQHPDPRHIYLLQFHNGYRCSRCVITRGRLYLLTMERTHRRAEDFAYPLAVRIVGKVHVFALALPLPEYPRQSPLSAYEGSASLVLPWEQPNRHALFAAKHRRFVRSREEHQLTDSMIKAQLGSGISERTKRRYRTKSLSEPHVDVLIQMTLEHFTTYTDALRIGGSGSRDGSRFSLETLLHATHFDDLLRPHPVAVPPLPEAVWETCRSEMGEWPAILSALLPQPSLSENKLIRLARGLDIADLDPKAGPGSWLSLDKVGDTTNLRQHSDRRGWRRPLYAFERGLDILFGHLAFEGGSLSFRSPKLPGGRTLVAESELGHLRRINGIVAAV